MDIVLWSQDSSEITQSPVGAPGPVAEISGGKGLWIDPVRFIALIEGQQLATWACAMAADWLGRRHPALPAGRHPGGAPPVYRDETVLLTLLVMRAWRLSLEKMANWLGRYGELAVALGMDPGRTISAAQLSRRGRHLGVWPDFFFIGLVLALLRLGAITGQHVILDGSLLKAWYQADPDADRAGRRRGPSTFGFKIHALVDRWTHLPLLFVLTPASWSEVAIAPFLLVSAITLYGLQIAVLYADAGYYTY
ncbi:MAG TPA: transposase, partial [Chloroflexota bacterium]|nr:transposase [Chloroflexota bacterium]